MGHIYLTGFMGAGKSTIAARLSRKYGYRELDMDSTIEQEERMKISEIFRTKGELHFRSLESALLKRLSPDEDLVVSCGGGAVLDPENVKEMKKKGVIIWLDADPEAILERVSRNHNRPLLEGHKDLAYIEKMMEERRPRYENAADHRVLSDSRPLDVICEEIRGYTR
ncbi:MAG: shikimate kinase [Blautia sp.]|nr:shikimate kinase [Blautia sp.]